MILIIDQNKKNANTLADIFYFMGILSLAVTPKEAMSEISPIYSSVLVSNPNSMPDAADLVYRLRSYSSFCPIFSISNEPIEDRCRACFDISFSENSYSSTIVKEIFDYQKKNSKSLIGVYTIAGIDASSDKPYPTYFDRKIPLTKTETMILRLLISAYPNPLTPKEILKYAFRHGKTPEASVVRTHISVMNKKFSSLFKKPLIVSVQDRGYIIPTPEFAEEASMSFASK